MGLSTLLASGSEAAEVIAPDPRSANLFILAAGPTPPNPTELLSSSLFSELIARFSKEFDLVLIDAPPAMLLADSVVMSTAVDGVLVVVRSGFSTRLTLMRVTELLRRNRAKVLGFVLNDVNTKSSEFYYANGYYGRDYYGKQPQTQF
jgi:capsular exopolysaccharide synthesis family protein